MGNGLSVANNILIFCELEAMAENGKVVTSKIKELGTWARINPSLWYVDSTLTASEVRDQITPLIKDGDCLFIANMSSGQAAWKGVSNPVTAFIKTHWNN